MLALRIVPAQFFRPVLLEPLIEQVVDRGNPNNARWTARGDLVDALASQEALTSRDFRQVRIDGLRHEKPMEPAHDRRLHCWRSLRGHGHLA